MSEPATGPAPELEVPDDAPIEVGVSLADMLATGATYRRLDYWTRSGILRPEDARPGTGWARHWTVRDRALCEAIVPLTAAGLSLPLAVAMAEAAVDEDRFEHAIETEFGAVTLTWGTPKVRPR